MTAAIAALVLAACHRSGGEDAAGTGSTGAVDAAAPAPPEHLAPGELVEGKEKAFGLALPRDVTVEHRYADVVWAHTNLQPAAVADFFKKRVDGGRSSITLNEATLEDVEVPGQPDKHLTIHLVYSPSHVATRIEIRDVTPPSLEGLPDEASRWRAEGLSPDGKILDPKTLH